MLIHPFEPVYDADSRVLILGSFPSPKSREYGFYYGHPQNAFWNTLAFVLGVPEPPYDIELRRLFLLRNRIAVWDVLRSCDIDGSSDISIKNPVANDFSIILRDSDIDTIFTTGKKATALFNTLASEKTGITAQYLPSTSPANRGRRGAEFLSSWAAVKNALDR